MHKEQMSRWEKDNFPLRVVTTEMQERVPDHTHDFVEIVIFQRGTAIHSLYSSGKKSSYTVMQGDCFSVLPQETHSFENGNRAFYYNIIFSPSLLAPHQEELSAFSTWDTLFAERSDAPRTKIHLPLNERLQLEEFLKQLTHELKTRSCGYKTGATALLLQILLTILRCDSQMMITSETTLRNTPDLLKVINMLEKSPENRYTLLQMAKTAGMSVSNFTQKFRLLTGVSPTEFLLSKRIEKAEHMLKNTDHPVYTIADMCGFNNINYFIKTFRRFRNTTPAKFRKSI